MRKMCLQREQRTFIPSRILSSGIRKRALQATHSMITSTPCTVVTPPHSMQFIFMGSKPRALCSTGSFLLVEKGSWWVDQGLCTERGSAPFQNDKER